MKDFLIIGNLNAVTYKEVFPLIKAGEVRLAHGFHAGNAFFCIPEGGQVNYAKDVYDPSTKLVKFRNCCWFTTLDNAKRHDPLTMTKHYNSADYPKYDNYDAIEVSRTKDIPRDYYGVMGVPISFMDKYCPEQFEIVKFRHGNDGKDLAINGKCPFLISGNTSLYVTAFRLPIIRKSFICA